MIIRFLVLVFGLYTIRNGDVPKVGAELYSIIEDSWKEIQFPQGIPHEDLSELLRCVSVDSSVFYFQG